MTVSAEMFRRTYAEINLDKLISNAKALKKVANDDRFFCPMVKANAYGHGDVQVAQALESEGFEHLGVCLIEEGLLLRNSGVKSQILVFRGFDQNGAAKIVENQMTPVVSTWEQLHSLDYVADETVKVHLKFNTGMNRLGFNADQSEKLFEYFKKSKKLKLKAVLTHLAQGEDAYLEKAFSASQMQIFSEIFDFFKPLSVYAHALNSGGIASLEKIKKLGKLNSHYLVKEKWGFRPGLMLYGYQPAADFREIPVQPVMTLKSVVNNIRTIKKGESVSYGCSWKAARDSKIAVVPIGYADGVHRLVSNSGAALFAGQKVPIVGRVCMDFLMLDITDVILGNTAKPIDKWNEEEVILFGEDQSKKTLSAEQMAVSSQTIVWETLTAVGERVPRHYKGQRTV